MTARALRQLVLGVAKNTLDYSCGLCTTSIQCAACLVAAQVSQQNWPLFASQRLPSSHGNPSAVTENTPPTALASKKPVPHSAPFSREGPGRDGKCLSVVSYLSLGRGATSESVQAYS